MIRTPAYGEAEIEEVLSRARVRNKEIGNYQEHSVKEEDYYTIVLDNGKILLFTAEIQNRHQLLPDRVSDIAERFRAKH